MPILPPELLHDLADAAIDAGLDRRVLLIGLPGAFTASLPTNATLSTQLRLDLDRLNRTPELVDFAGHPLATWLENALRNSHTPGPRADFTRARATLLAPQRLGGLRQRAGRRAVSLPWPDWAYSGQPPAWAVEWGEGQDGVFVTFAVGEVVQRLRWIPPDGFQMGSPYDEPDRWAEEGPQRLVRLTRGFWLADTPVTQALWLAVMGDNPSHSQGDLRRPVEKVSWDDTQRFLDRLRTEHGFTAALPTEAQWEYACRAGTTTRYWSGDAEADLARVGWYEGNSEGTTHPVGQKPANPWGLHDMHGNVWEWCADYWQNSYQGAQTDDPTCPARGERRVLRGGSWGSTARRARSAHRYGSPPGGSLPVPGLPPCPRSASPGGLSPGRAEPGGPPGAKPPRRRSRRLSRAKPPLAAQRRSNFCDRPPGPAPSPGVRRGPAPSAPVSGRNHLPWPAAPRPQAAHPWAGKPAVAGTSALVKGLAGEARDRNIVCPIGGRLEAS